MTPLGIEEDIMTPLGVEYSPYYWWRAKWECNPPPREAC
jgi:hypothetical protein